MQGYIYMVEVLTGGMVDATPKPTLVITDLHHGQTDCGPIAIEYPQPCTKINCDRLYSLGNGEANNGEDNTGGVGSRLSSAQRDGYGAFLDSLQHGWLIQDTHDPNDFTWCVHRPVHSS